MMSVPSRCQRLAQIANKRPCRNRRHHDTRNYPSLRNARVARRFEVNKADDADKSVADFDVEAAAEEARHDNQLRWVVWSDVLFSHFRSLSFGVAA
jgi:hypothetical protein